MVHIVAAHVVRIHHERVCMSVCERVLIDTTVTAVVESIALDSACIYVICSSTELDVDGRVSHSVTNRRYVSADWHLHMTGAFGYCDAAVTCEQHA